MSNEEESEDGVESEPKKKKKKSSNRSTEKKGKELARRAKVAPPKTPVRVTFGLLNFRKVSILVLTFASILLLTYDRLKMKTWATKRNQKMALQVSTRKRSKRVVTGPLLRRKEKS